MELKERVTIFSVIILVAELALGRAVFSANWDAKKMDMKKLFPLEIGSYQFDGKDEFYNRKTTFRYMDGAAELYRSYGFKLLYGPPLYKSR